MDTVRDSNTIHGVYSIPLCVANHGYDSGNLCQDFNALDIGALRILEQSNQEKVQCGSHFVHSQLERQHLRRKEWRQEYL